MSESITIEVHGGPVAQSRPSINTKTGKAYYSNAHVLALWKDAITLAARKSMDRRRPHSGEVHLTMTFYLPRPKSHHTSADPHREVRACHVDTPALTKPDWDNYAKAVCDALEGEVYENDSQVTFASVFKVYQRGDEKVGVVILAKFIDREATT